MTAIHFQPSRANLPSAPAKLNTDRAADDLAKKVGKALWVLFAVWIADGLVTEPLDAYSSTAFAVRGAIQAFTYVALGRILFLVATHLPILKRTAAQQKVSTTAVTLLLSMSVFQVCNGFLQSESAGQFYVRVWPDFVPIASSLIVYAAAACRPIRDQLLKMIGAQCAITGGLILLVMWKYPINLDRSNVSDPHGIALSLGAITAVGVSMLHMLRTRDKILVLFGFVCFSALMLSYQSRGGTLNVFVFLPLGLLALHFFAGNLGIRKLLRTVVIGLPLLAIGLAAASQVDLLREAVEVGLQGTNQRLFGTEEYGWNTTGFIDSVQMEVDNSRGIEAEEFISKATPLVWLIGRGMTGSWHSDVMNRGNEWPIVHFGPLHMVLKGGIPLALVYLGIFGIAMRRAMAAIRSDPWAVTTVSTVLYYLSDFIKHGPVTHGYYNSILWLIVGIAFSLSAKPASHREILVSTRRAARVFLPSPAVSRR